MNKPLKGFIAYSHEDSAAKIELKKRLSELVREGMIKTWDDGEITPGGKARQQDILKELPDSDLLLYLVSAASLHSENCNKELAEALQFEIRVIPIILEHCDWLNHQLSDFQALPDQGKPINEWVPDSKGWQNVVDGIRKAVKEMQTRISDSVQKGPLPEWVFQQGNFLMMLGQIDKAIEAYSHAIDLNPDDVNAYNNRGVACGVGQNYNRAITDFDKAVQLKPNFADAYTNRGKARTEQNKHDLAIKDLSKAIRLRPNEAVSYFDRGTTYVNKGDYDRAIEDFNKAIDLEPDYADVFYNRGVAYIKKDEVQRVIEDFNKAIDLNPDYAETYYTRGLVWLHKGQWANAKSDLEVASSKGIDIVTRFCANYGNILDFKRRFDVELPEDIVTMLTPKATDMGGEKARDTAHPVEPDVKIAIKRIKKKYERAWKTLAKL